LIIIFILFSYTNSNICIATKSRTFKSIIIHYLTGFHKRKVQRAKQAQEEAAKKAREERITTRKQLREERRQELEEHVEAVNTLLKDVKTPGLDDDDTMEDESWGGIGDDTVPDLVDHEEEYIDEDRYTTVTVEAVNVSKDGLQKAADEEGSDEDMEDGEGSGDIMKEAGKDPTGKKTWPKKPRKKKFRYESKAERKVTWGKQRAGNRAKADARRGND